MAYLRKIEKKMNNYNPHQIETKWQEIWDKEGIFKSKEDSSLPKYYVLEMFPYPSGKIHMGHLRNYAIGDAIARHKIMQGFNVLHPMGWDAFGLPAENAAIERKIHPKIWTLENIENMKKQLKPIGFSYDWTREIATCLPNYYKHEQKIFLDFYKNGFAYQKEAEVNWDPVDNTVLANEQVINGKGWRSGAIVEKKKLKQWFLKVTDFAESLYSEIDELTGWPDAVRATQRKWIGKSIGAEIHFQISGKDQKLAIYSTRPETIFGASFCAISPSHPIADKLSLENKEILSFIDECKKSGTAEEYIEKAEKKGIFTGLYADHPFQNKKLPIYIANFVLMDFGTGAIFGCPAHDDRDKEFAKLLSLPIIEVISTDNKIINSDFLNDLDIGSAKEKVIKTLEEKNLGNKKINYRLRDWGISRQRYWGCPIPIIHCGTCGPITVPENQLPVALPDDVDFSIPGNPLANHPSWKHVSCPVCNKDAKRETDSFDTFFDSSWYFLRFCNPNFDGAIDKEACKYWMCVDRYIGGIEHAALHLLYARFFTKAMSKCGYFDIKEPFTNLLTQGMILHETYKDQNGSYLYPEEAKNRKDVVIGRVEKMSKSKKNVVDPDDLIKKYGADAARLFVLSDSPPERDLEWSDAGIEGCFKYLNRLWNLVHNFTAKKSSSIKASDEKTEIRKKIHSTINLVTNCLSKMQFNSAIALIRELNNEIIALDINDEKNHVSIEEGLSVIITLLSPFTPHIAEALWKEIGNKEILLKKSWPIADPSLLENDSYILAIQVNGKLRATISVPSNTSKEELQKIAFAEKNVVKAIENKEIKKIIIIPNKIVNIVI